MEAATSFRFKVPNDVYFTEKLPQKCKFDQYKRNNINRFIKLFNLTKF